MRNASITFLISLLCAVACFVACSDEEPVVVEGDDVVYTGMLPVDSLSFSTHHHYWKGYRFHTTDTLSLLSSVPTGRWLPDTLQVAPKSECVVADIVRVPTDSPDSIWLKMVLLSDTCLSQGWTSETDLLHAARPTHFVARLLSFFGPMADVPGGDYSDAWLNFYFHPTANPFLLPWPMACVVLFFWALLIVILAMFDKYIIEPHRYRCGRCGALLKNIGTCPRCGAENKSPNIPSLSTSTDGEKPEQKSTEAAYMASAPETMLLHCCCAPCSSAILEWMLNNGVRPVLYFCNPNIYPYEEYLIRKDELTRHAQRLGLRIIDDDYDHAAWLAAVKGLENEPERGGRCLQCFKYRLLRAARMTQELGLPEFTTTLASSRWKSLDQINEAGLWAAAEVNASLPEGASPITFNTRNWRKGGLQERRNQLLREYAFYNQQYCGCEFSMRSVEKE